jgi:hypothetical protein
MPPSALDRLLQRQGEALDTLSDEQARAFLRIFDDARRELREQLEAMAPAGREAFTGRQAMLMLAQLEGGVAQLQVRLTGELDRSLVGQQHRALDDLLKVLSVGDRLDATLGSRIEIQALAALAQPGGLLLHRASLRRYGAGLIEETQRQLAVGLARGQTWRQITDRLAGPQGVLAEQRARAALIVQMEMARAYNASHQTSLVQAAAVLDAPGIADPLLAKATEYFDNRNHPFSRALDGRLRPVDGVWEVPLADVRLWADRLKKKAGGGILWAQQGGKYVGNTYPAHYGDRGRQVPWRASWAR